MYFFVNSGIISTKHFLEFEKRRPGIKRTHRAGQNGPTKNLYDFSKVMNKCDKSWAWPRLWRISQNSHILIVSRGPELVSGSRGRSSDATRSGFLMKSKQPILDKRASYPWQKWTITRVFTLILTQRFSHFFSAHKGFQGNPYRQDGVEILDSILSVGILLLGTN